MDGQKYAFEIGMITPPIAASPIYKYTILTLEPARVLFHGYGGEIAEVHDTAKAHIAFLKAQGEHG